MPSRELGANRAQPRDSAAGSNDWVYASRAGWSRPAVCVASEPAFTGNQRNRREEALKLLVLLRTLQLEKIRICRTTRCVPAVGKLLLRVMPDEHRPLPDAGFLCPLRGGFNTGVVDVDPDQPAARRTDEEECRAG